MKFLPATASRPRAADSVFKGRHFILIQPVTAMDEFPKTPVWTLRGALAPGIEAVKGHWLTFLVIQSFGLAFVIAYYRSRGIQDWAAELADFKVQWGLLFAFGSMFLACTVIPELAKLITGKLKTFDRAWAGKALFTGLVYGIVGIQVDIFYRYQAVWFGTGTDPRTFLLKTLVDMALFSTIISIPTATLMFEWRKHGFSWRRFREDFLSRGLQPSQARHRQDADATSFRPFVPSSPSPFSPWFVFYRDRVLPGLIPCWAFWTPVLLCTYSMPMNLQFCFTMFAEAAWSLLFVFIATRED